MSLADIPRSVQVESQRADPDTVFTHGQKRAIRTAIKFHVTVFGEYDYSRILKKINDGMVLPKRERRHLQQIINDYGKQRLDPHQRKMIGWVKSDLWDAHRPADY